MGKLHIDVLDTSFTVQSTESDEYLEKLLGFYKTTVRDVSKIPSVKTPLQTSILAGIMLCNEVYKLKEREELSQLEQKNKKNLPPENNNDSEELERITISLIDKINRVL